MAGFEETLDKAFRAVSAINDAGGHAVNGFMQFIIIRVVGERDGMIDAEAVFSAGIDCPTGDGKTDLRLHSIGPVHAGRHDQGMAGDDLSGEKFASAQ